MKWYKSLGLLPHTYLGTDHRGTRRFVISDTHRLAQREITWLG